jgi:ABC-type transport system involved in multi-copper enzyme maturation permease subunit
MSLLRAEYRKITRRKVFPVMTLLLLVFVGLGAFFLIVFGEVAPEAAEGLPVLEKPGVYAVGAQQAATQTWFPLILAVVLLGGELSTTVWATSLTRDARRLSQILARFGTYAMATAVAFVLAFALWVIVALIFSPGQGFMETGELVGVLWKAGAIAVAWTALGTGAVAILRSVGPAIGAGLAIYFAESFLALWDPWENVSLTAATTGLFRVEFGGGFGGFVPGLGLELWHQLSILAGWTLLGLGLTWWGLQRRDA